MRADFEFDKDCYPYAAAPLGANTAKVWHVPTLTYVMGEPVPTKVAEVYARNLNSHVREQQKRGVKYDRDNAKVDAYDMLKQAVSQVQLTGTEAMAVTKALELLKPN